MADRSPSKTDTPAPGVETKTVARIGPEEEKVLRMRHGIVAPDSLPLDRVGQDDPEVAARLREIELEAYRQSGRLDELRRDLDLEARPDADSETKAKIIDRLRNLTPED